MGAGLAGTTAARYAAKGIKKGTINKVLLLESQTFPGERIKCAEGVRYDVFSDIGLLPREEWIKSYINTIYLILPNGKRTYLSSPGYVIDKRRLLTDLEHSETFNSSQLGKLFNRFPTYFLTLSFRFFSLSY